MEADAKQVFGRSKFGWPVTCTDDLAVSSSCCLSCLNAPPSVSMSWCDSVQSCLPGLPSAASSLLDALRYGLWLWWQGGLLGPSLLWNWDQQGDIETNEKGKELLPISIVPTPLIFEKPHEILLSFYGDYHRGWLAPPRLASLRLEAPLHSSEWGSCPVLIFSARFLAEAEILRDIRAVVLPSSILCAMTQGELSFTRSPIHTLTGCSSMPGCMQASIIWPYKPLARLKMYDNIRNNCGSLICPYEHWRNKNLHVSLWVFLISVMLIWHHTQV